MWIMSITVIVGSTCLINRWSSLLIFLFHILVFAQGAIPFIMAHIPGNGELGLAVLYADGVRVPLTFRMLDDGLAYVTSQSLSL
jgi:hypothetical protein